MVPNAKLVNFTRQVRAVRDAQHSALVRNRPTIARFLLDGPVLPPVTETLTVAESFRRTLMGIFQRQAHDKKYGRDQGYQEAFRSPLLSGKDAAGQPLRSHGHAYYLPADEDGDGRIDHLTVIAEDGFGGGEVNALDACRSFRVGEDQRLRLLLVGLGNGGDFRAPLLSPSRTWLSATPFIVTRHVKRRGRRKDPPECWGLAGREAFAERVLVEELARLRLRRSEMAEIPVQVSNAGTQMIGGTEPRLFRRGRPGKADDGWRRAFAFFCLEFDTPVAGPLALGYASHFGMGLFFPSAKNPGSKGGN